MHFKLRSPAAYENFLRNVYTSRKLERVFPWNYVTNNLARNFCRYMLGEM